MHHEGGAQKNDEIMIIKVLLISRPVPVRCVNMIAGFKISNKISHMIVHFYAHNFPLQKI